MPSESVSFRISRSAQDLAETIHALSQRLVAMEQRLVVMEQRLDQPSTIDPQELSSLERVGQLLHDCRQLLAVEPSAPLASVPPETSVGDIADAELVDGEESDVYAAA
jgi:hypothetical protein